MTTSGQSSVPQCVEIASVPSQTVSAPNVRVVTLLLQANTLWSRRTFSAQCGWIDERSLRSHSSPFLGMACVSAHSGSRGF